MSFQASWDALRSDARVRLLQEFASSGAHGRLLLVGGCLRDSALERETKDLDLVVERDAAALAGRYGELTGATVVRLGGERFAALRVVDSGAWIDLLDLEGTTLDDDLRRRDLTVNAIAVDVASGQVVDPARGRDDLERRLLRATRAGVFAEDPLRTLRLARFALALPGFVVEAATLELARDAARALDSVARERVRDELDRILAGPDLGAALALLERLGVSLFDDEGARRLNARAASAGRLGDAAPVLPDRDRLSLHWAFLGAAASADPDEARRRVADARTAGLLSRATADAASILLAPSWEAPPGGLELRHWVYEAGGRWRDAIRLRGALAAEAGVIAGWLAFAARVDAMGEAAIAALVEPPVLVDGDAAQALLGLRPGRALGELLAALRRAQIEGRVESREEAEAFLRRLRV